MLGLLAWTLVTSYLVAALFALVRTWKTGAHGFRRLSARGTVRVVLEVAVWPPEESWLRLREYFSQQWAAAQPRWQEVGS